MPPIDSVTQVGSPENSSSYSGVRRKRTIRSLMTKSSMISWACASVSVPAVEVALRSRRRGRSRCGPATSPRRSAPSPPPGRRSTATARPRGRSRPGRRCRSRRPRPSASARSSARICSASSSRSRMTSSVDGARVERGLLVLLALDQPVDAVERDAAVVADDPAAAVGVGQAGDDVRAAAARTSAV